MYGDVGDVGNVEGVGGVGGVGGERRTPLNPVHCTGIGDVWDVVV